MATVWLKCYSFDGRLSLKLPNTTCQLFSYPFPSAIRSLLQMINESPGSIAIADNHQLIRQTLIQVLTSFGYHVIIEAENGKSLIESKQSGIINNFNCDAKPITEFEFHLNRFGKADEENIEQVYVVEAMDGQLISNKLIEPITSFKIVNDIIQTNTEKDLLYMVVVNRYSNAPVAQCFVTNFGLKKGAIASSVAHDSHNIIAVGVDADSLCRAVNLIIAAKGGVSAVNEKEEHVLPLPVAGLMSADDGYKVAEAYSNIDAAAKALGSTLSAPFMTLSFMGLLVIPHLKLSDMGLFDGDSFRLV